MTEEAEVLIQQVSINQVLISILEEYKSLKVSTIKFAEAAKVDKELVIDYDENGPSFTFSLRDKNEQ